VIRYFRDRKRWETAAESDGYVVEVVREHDYPHPDDATAPIIAMTVVNDPDPQLGEQIGDFDQARGIGVLASTTDELADYENGVPCEVLCANCGGTILAPAVMGMDRGSCHCEKRGSVFGRRTFDEATRRVVWTYRVRWITGHVCSPTWPDQGSARAYLDMLRAGTRAPEFPAEGTPYDQ